MWEDGEGHEKAPHIDSFSRSMPRWKFHAGKTCKKSQKEENTWMRAGKEAEMEENSLSTTISNIKLYNLVRDSLKSNASLLLSVDSSSYTVHLRVPGDGRFQDQLFTVAIDIFIDERYVVAIAKFSKV